MVIGYGNGVKPYLLDKRKDERCPMPSYSDIKVVVCDLLSRATMITSKKSTKRWNEAIAKTGLLDQVEKSGHLHNLKHSSLFLNIELIT